MKKQSLEEIFSELKDYVGSALRVLRISKSLSKSELNLELSNAGFSHTSEKLIDDIEENKTTISFYELIIICRAMNITIENYLKMMQSLQQGDTINSSYLKKQLENEIDYLLWEKEQS